MEKRRAAAEALMREHLLPAAEQMRDRLLAIKIPAKVQFLPDTGDGGVSLMFYVSDDRRDFDQPAAELKFHAGYVLKGEMVCFTTNRSDVETWTGSEHAREEYIPYNDLTNADASRRFSRFAMNCFHALREQLPPFSVESGDEPGGSSALSAFLARVRGRTTSGA